MNAVVRVVGVEELIQNAEAAAVRAGDEDEALVVVGGRGEFGAVVVYPDGDSGVVGGYLDVAVVEGVLDENLEVGLQAAGPVGFVGDQPAGGGQLVERRSDQRADPIHLAG